MCTFVCIHLSTMQSNCVTSVQRQTTKDEVIWLSSLLLCCCEQMMVVMLRAVHTSRRTAAPTAANCTCTSALWNDTSLCTTRRAASRAWSVANSMHRCRLSSVIVSKLLCSSHWFYFTTHRYILVYSTTIGSGIRQWSKKWLGQWVIFPVDVNILSFLQCFDTGWMTWRSSSL